MTAINPGKFSTSQGRWATLGSYYCTFPVSLAHDVIGRFCPAGGSVLDPFCGRGTAPFIARVTGRSGFGGDQSPVAYVFASAKCDPEPDVNLLLQRVETLNAAVDSSDIAPTDFMNAAFSTRVFRFLMSARRNLDWRNDRTDRTLMALILACLHDRAPYGLSNQMARVIAPGPDYAVRWWRDRGLTAPDHDPVAFMKKQIAYRYKYGVPNHAPFQIEFCDARDIVKTVNNKFDLLFTSPPYSGVSDYRRDQWLRLWMLGDNPFPHSSDNAQKWSNKSKYEEMMRNVFSRSISLLKKNAVIYVRTDYREFTRDLTLKLVSENSPALNRIYWRHEISDRSSITKYQSPGRKGTPGEVDIISAPPDIAAPVGFQEVFRNNIAENERLAA